jgi:hypothetical protein
LKRDYGSSISVVFPAYEASGFDKGKTYVESRNDGVASLKRLMKRCPDSQSVLGGYSQGADVAGKVASDIGHGRGPVPAARVAAVGLVADPNRGSAPVVGKKLAGTGIAGSRPGGFGALEPKVFQLCDDKDLYCNVTGNNPFLKTLGKTLGSATAGEVPQLVSDFSGADLPGTASTASLLKEHTQNLSAPTSAGQSAEIAQIGALAQQVLSTFGPLAQTQDFIRRTPGAATQLEGPAGSDQAKTRQVLSTLDKMDTDSIVSTAQKVTSLSSQITGQSPVAPSTTDPAVSGEAPVLDEDAAQEPSEGAPATSSVGTTTGTGSVNAGDVTSLASSALSLASQVAPMGSQDQQNLAAASSVLSTIRIETIVSQGMNVMSAVLGTDYAGVGRNLQLLPQQLIAGDVHGAHRTARTINVQLSPWVKMAAQLDFKTASQVVSMIPDPQGYAQIAALVLDLMGNVDIIRLAHDVGQIQEVAWSVLKSGNPIALMRLVPIGLDLGAVALGVLAPGTKMSPELLGSNAAPQSVALATSNRGTDIGSLLSGVSDLAGSPGAMNLAKLVGEGLDAAAFLNSTAHTSAYLTKKTFGGRTAVDFMYDRFRQALGG